jgi:CPA2 family monovalent cation:H+ antiporter-2
MNFWCLAAAEAGGHGAGGVVYDLGVIAAGAAVALFVFTRLKLPAIFGYLLAGLLLGGGLGLPTPIHNFGVVQELSELGVIFLLFFIGMEFDLKRLQAMFWPVLIALVLQTIAMIYLAHFFASLLGWGGVSALFLGSLLAISSSMVTVRILNEQGRMQLPHAQLAVGILILEDVLAIVLLVILTGVAVNQRFDWDAAWLVIFLMGVFVFAVFTIGRILAPRILQKIATGGTDENGTSEQLTVISVGLVLGISVLALTLKFSPALGAFLAGAMLSQTRFVHTLEQTNRSLHDLFSAIFFVTIGMLIEPSMIFANIGWILLLSALVVMGKIGACWLGLFLAGQPTRTSFRAASAKSQIGEFSFIIAGLGQSLGVTDTQLSAIAFGVAFVTILMTPLVARYSGENFDRLEKLAPNRLKSFGAFYHEIVDSVVAQLGKSRILQLLKPPLGRIVANFLLVNAVLIAGYFLAQFLSARFPEFEGLGQLLLWLGIAFCLLPFLLVIIHNLNAIVFTLTDAIFETQDERPVLQGRLRTLFNGLSIFISSVVVGGLYLPFAAPWLPGRSILVVVVGFLGLVGIIFWQRLAQFNQRLEGMFIQSFREHVQSAEEACRSRVMSDIEERYPWEVQVREFLLPAESTLVGRRLRDSGIREATGATVIAIGRGGFQVFDPAPGSPLFPGDVLFVIGTAEQLDQVSAHFNRSVAKESARPESESFDVRPIYLAPGSGLDGNTLAGAEVRRRFGVSVIGLQRGEIRVTSPRPDQLLKAGDVLYVVGQPRGLDRFSNLCEEAGSPETSEIVI